MTDADGAKLTTWTLGAIKKRRFALEGYCETDGCGRFYMFDVDGLIDRFGAEWLVPEHLPVDCMECGGTAQTQVGVVPPKD